MIGVIKGILGVWTKAHVENEVKCEIETGVI